LREITLYSHLEDYTTEVTERASYINARHGKKFDTLFKPRVSMYLPPCDVLI
jgi:hypothetical protein